MQARSRWLPSPVLSLVLFFVWLLLNNSLSPGNLILALLLAWLIPLFTSRLETPGPTVQRPLAALRYLLVLLWDIVVANLQVAVLILGPKKRLRPGFVKVPLDLKESGPMTILASTVSLTPGTISADILAEGERRILLIHVLDLADEAALVHTIKARYEAPLREIFAC